jgi:hypothetical protein
MARADNAVTMTILGEMIPTLISPRITASAARQEVFRPRCVQYDLTGTGGAHDVVTTPAVTFGAVTEGTEFPEDAFDTGKRTITPALYGVDVMVGIGAWTEAALSPLDAIVKETALALALHRDSVCAALYTEAPASTPDHEIGTDATEFNFTTLRDGSALLYTQNAPKRFAWVIYPAQWIELLKDDTFINASVKGSPVLTSGMGENGYVTSVLDVDVYVSDQIDESSGRHSMMFSDKAAFGYGFKRLPVPGNESVMQELMVHIDYEGRYRSYIVESTYFADFEGVKGSSTTTNNWLVDIIS